MRSANQLNMSTTTENTIKVKIFYTLRGSRFRKFTTIQVPAKYNKDSKVLVSLRSCLLSICSASPDIICRDHDLSIYTANLEESGEIAGVTKDRDEFVWEGHGLISWLLDPNRDENNDIFIHGEQRNGQNINTENRVVELHINLQPTLKWTKDEFQQALKLESLQQLKQFSSTPNHQFIRCNCYEQLEQQHNHSTDNCDTVNALSSPINLPTPTNVYNSHHTILPSLTASVPPMIHRPEPIFPITTTNSNVNRIPSPPFQQSRADATVHLKEQQQSHPYRQKYSPPLPLPLPLPNSLVTQSTDHGRRSAFTLAAGSSAYKRKNSDTLKMPPDLSTTAHHSYSSASYSSSSSASSSSASSSPIAGLLPSETATTSNHRGSQNRTEKYTETNNNNKKRRRKSSSTSKHPADRAVQGLSSNNQHQQRQTTLLPPSAPLVPAQQHQISTAVRTYYEVDKDVHGNYILPVEIDSWTVVELGTVIYDRPAYHNQRYIYPVNYTVKKWYRSMVDPQSDTQYTCRILENGREPKFEVTADDCDMTYSGPTPTTVWTIIVRRAFNIRNQEYGHNPVGPDFFGLRKNTIAKMIQDLPNASKCSRYVWQNFEPAKFNKPGSRTRRRTDSSGHQQSYSMLTTASGGKVSATVAPVIRGTPKTSSSPLITSATVMASTPAALIGGLNYGLTNGNRGNQHTSISVTKKGNRKLDK